MTEHKVTASRPFRLVVEIDPEVARKLFQSKGVLSGASMLPRDYTEAVLADDFVLFLRKSQGLNFIGWVHEVSRELKESLVLRVDGGELHLSFPIFPIPIDLSRLIADGYWYHLQNEFHKRIYLKEGVLELKFIGYRLA